MPSAETQPAPSHQNETRESKPDMIAFRAKITALIAERKEKYIDMMELNNVNPDHLTEEDAKMWYKAINYTKGLVTQPQFQEYRKGITDIRDVKNPIYLSRENFQAVIANKLFGQWSKEDFEDES